MKRYRTASSPGSVRVVALVAMASASLIPAASYATEGGVGRPITGMQIAPYSGIVPPTSDWIVSVTSIYYEGSLGVSKASG